MMKIILTYSDHNPDVEVPIILLSLAYRIFHFLSIKIFFSPIQFVFERNTANGSVQTMLIIIRYIGGEHHFAI